MPKGDSSKFLSKTANSSSQSVLFSLSHLVKQVTADENSLVLSSLSNKVTAFLCCFRVQKKKKKTVFFVHLCSPTRSIVVTPCSLNIIEILPYLSVLRIQGEHWREGELLLTYTHGEGELNINQKVFNHGGKTAKFWNCRNRRNLIGGVEL